MNPVQLVEQKSIAKSLEVRKSKDDSSKSDMPAFRPGDTVNVAVRVIEGEKERIQMFTGTVIARRGSGLSETVALDIIGEQSSRPSQRKLEGTEFDTGWRAAASNGARAAAHRSRIYADRSADHGAHASRSVGAGRAR